MKDPTKSERSQLPGEDNPGQEVFELKRLLKEKELQLQHLAGELAERKKELWCHNRISLLLDDVQSTPGELFEKVAAIIPQAFQYADHAAAVVHVRGVNYYSPDYRESDISLSVDIQIRTNPAGYIRVYYHLNGSGQTAPVFLPEEKELLSGISSRLAAYLEKTDQSELLRMQEKESRQLSESLAEEGQRFKRLFERMAQGVVYQDAGGGIFMANPAAEEMLGLTFDQMQGRTSIDPRWRAIREDGTDFPGEQHPAMEALHTGRPVRNRVMGIFHPLKERYTWILVSAEPEFKAGETIPFQVFTTFTDITGLKNTELELEESRRFMSDLIENSGSLVYVKDLDGRYITVNRRWEEVAGVSRDIAYLKTDAQIYEKDSAMAFVRNDLLVMESEKILEVEEALLTPSGTHYFLSVKFPVRDKEGKVNGLCGISLEVTDRKRVELELRKSEEKYRSLIDSSDAAISMVDFEGAYLYVNRIAAEPFGLSPEALTGTRVDQLMKPHHARQIMNDVRWVISANRGMVLEPEVDIAGERRWYRTSIQPVRDEKGHAFAAMIHATNITENKLAEEKEKASAQRYQTLFYTSPVAYLIIQDGKFTDCNRATELLIRGDRSMFIGKTPAMISPEFQPGGERSDEFSAEILELAYRKGSHTFEWVHSRFDGTDFLAQISLTSMELDGHRVLFAIWQDISIKRKAEEEIRKLTLAVEQSPVSIVITDIQGNIEYANPKACETTGYTLEELLNQNPRVLKSGETSAWEYDVMWDTISGGREWKGIFHNKRKNGEMYWEASTIAPIKNEEGVITHYLAVKEDISEKKKMEETLAANESRLREIAEQSRSVIWEVDLEGMYTYMSPVSELVYGYTPEELTGKKFFWDIQPEEMHDELKALTLEVIGKGEKLHDFVNPIIRKDGKLIWVSTNATPVYDSGRNIVGYRGSDNDITARKLAEEELRKFRTISDQANYGTAITDLEGVLLYVNEAFARKHGWKQAELTGNNLFIVHNEEQKPQIQELLSLLKRDGEFKTQEVWHTRRDGSVFPTLMTAKVIYDNHNVPQFMSATVIDISEKKAQEERIRLQHERLNAIINAMPDKIFVHDADGYFLEYYTHDPDKLLVSGDKLIGMNLRDVFESDAAELNILKIRECLAEQKLVMHEFSTSVGGAVLHLEVRVVPVSKTTVLRFVRDITDRKEDEMALRRLTLAIEQSPVAIVVTDRDANITYVSPAFTTITGYTAPDVVGRSTRILKSGKTPEEVYRKMWQTITSGVPWHGEWENRRKNGRLFWEKVAISPVVDSDGNITSYLAVKEDITEKKKTEKKLLELNLNLERKVAQRTRELGSINKELIREVVERKKAEAELQEKTEELERFFSVALDLLSIGDTSGRFLMLNQSWETITGFSVEELMNMHFIDLVHPEDREETLAILEVLKIQSRIVGFTNRYRTRQGEYRNIEWHAVLVGERIYAAARDVTSRIRLEQSLQENIEREKELSEMKSRFVSVASHEFRTPLAAIMMTGETLLNYWKRMDEEKIEARLKTIIEQVRHLGSIVANVMQVSKIQEGKMSFEPGEVELVGLCREMIRDFNIRHNNAIDFSSDFRELTVRADRRLILQSLTNLVSNAVKYAQPDPRVKVRIGESEDHLLVSVEDNGIGIPESDRQYLFQPFYRATNAARIEGNGLGLNIVRESIRMHGGDVWFESRLNEGTVFYLQLPKILIMK